MMIENALIRALTVLALMLTAAPWLGILSGSVDVLSSLLPIALALALSAVIWAGLRRRWWLLLLSLCAIGLAAGRMLPEWTTPLPAPDARGSDSPRIVIETHNLKRGGTSPAAQARALAAGHADILLFQERRGRGAAVTQALAPLYPYRDRCDACELAILSRLPLRHVAWRLRDRNGEYVGPQLFRATVEVPGGGTIGVMTVHMPWPLPQQGQAHARATLIDAIRQQQGSDRLILAGDFNLTPWGAAMRQLDKGLWPMTRITRARFSFPARLWDRDWPLPLLPIDHMFVGRDFGVERVETMPATGSDHLPVRVTLRLLRAGDASRNWNEAHSW